MGFDQTINYKVNVDDSNFQAKLTQMRASIDSTVSGSYGRAMSYMGPAGGGNFGNVGLGGMFSDFGSQIQPVTYTPPAIAMQPHFGMFQVQQTLSQAGLAASFGPAGIYASSIPSFGFFGKKDFLPPSMSYSEYAAYSTKNFADRAGGMAVSGAATAMNLGANLAGGMVGTAAASAMGMGFLGTMGLSMLGGSLAAAPIAAATDRAVDQTAIQNALGAGSFRFYQGANVDPITGRGFNRSDRNDIARSIMRMESNDARFNTTDYRQILEGGMQMDLFSGTKDADDFKQKFKGLVETVKTVSSTLHTSLKEGLETIRGLRDMGVTDASTQQSMVLRAETFGRASGRTGMEMMQIGQAGAEMFRGTGISMQRGFELNQQNALMVKQMLNGGTLSRESVAQAGGELSMAQQLTASALGSFQTTQGRGFMMAAFNPAAMSLDPSMVAKIASGDVIGGMANAASVMSSPGNMIKFQAHQAEMISKLNPSTMQYMDIAQGAATANSMMRSGLAGNASFEDTFRAMQLRSGKSQEIVDAQVAMMKMDPSEMKSNMKIQMTNMSNQMMGENQRDRMWGYKAAGSFFARHLFQPASEILTGWGNSVGTSTENFLTDMRVMFTGELDPRQSNSQFSEAASDFIQARVNSKLKASVDAIERSTGRKLTQDEIKQMGIRKAKAVLGPGSVYDYSRSLTDFTFRGAGTDFLKEVEGIDGKVGDTVFTKSGVGIRIFGSEAEMENYAQENGNVQMISSRNGKFYTTTAESLGKGALARRKMLSTAEEIEKAGKQIGPVTKAMKDAIRRNGYGLAGILKTFGKTKEDYYNNNVSSDEAATIAYYAKETGFKEELESMAAKSDQETSVTEHMGKHTEEDFESALKRIDKDADIIEGRNNWYSFGFSDLSKFVRKDAGSRAKLLNVLTDMSNNVKLSQDDIERTLGKGSSSVAKALFNSKPEQISKLLDSTQFLAAADIRKNAEGDQMSQQSGVGVAGYTGLTQAQFESMKTLADNLEIQMKTLISLQQQLASNMKR